ncbi:MAG TPA: flagellar biosynthetic protein FliR [Terriglobales bacterium]|nr:flagellar biosynthetic protein FliR [Terriglobales bacterium]
MSGGIFENATLFLLIFTRFTGALFFNPLFARRSVPSTLKSGLAFMLALIVFGTVNGAGIVAPQGDFLVLIMLGAKELFIGFVLGFLLELLFGTAVMAGELIDLQLGFSMSKIYDPASGASIPLSATLLNLLLTLMFFLSGGHLTLVRILALTFRVLPPGASLLGAGAAQYIVELFGQFLVAALKLALPVIAAELLAEFGMGVLMRAAPQINIFSVGLQLRVVLGLALLLLIVPALSRAMDSLTTYTFEKMATAIKLMG